MLLHLAITAAVCEVKFVIGVGLAFDAHQARLCGVSTGSVVPLVPKNSPGVFGDDAATSEGHWSSCNVQKSDFENRKVTFPREKL